MDGIIRKIKLVYPFIEVGNHKNGGLQKASVFSVDDTTDKFNGNKIHSIIKTRDEDGEKVFKVYVVKEEEVRLWKTITPDNCTEEVEYFI